MRRKGDEYGGRAGGRKKLIDKNPLLVKALEALVDPVTRGEPMSPLRWTCKSVRQLSKSLSERGQSVSYQVVSERLHKMGYRLQANMKKFKVSSHAERDKQFSSINEQVKHSLAEGWPVVSVDTKKKELVVRYRNTGREWQPKGHPEKMNCYDYVNMEAGKALPDGVYDI